MWGPTFGIGFGFGLSLSFASPTRVSSKASIEVSVWTIRIMPLMSRIMGFGLMTRIMGLGLRLSADLLR